MLVKKEPGKLAFLERLGLHRLWELWELLSILKLLGLAENQDHELS